jgi:hypothetical protein
MRHQASDRWVPERDTPIFAHDAGNDALKNTVCICGDSLYVMWLHIFPGHMIASEMT